MPHNASFIRVKAMLVIPHPSIPAHLVSAHAPTLENPRGFHRLIGGSVEFGETHREAIIREVREELGARITDLTYLDTVESLFRYDGERGHEIVALYSGGLDPLPEEYGGSLTESDGSVVPVAWRPIDAETDAVPLYPAAAERLVRSVLTRTAR
ncbi:8-oxo-dGTP pyrophosphatase MutT (NUDIX family) [Microbacterium testaceum]|uniref:NUDIX domain-containing protein n=1 Tax=Microbacterium TaxID=33882 RepID=UPI00278B1011|nr:MULTISPECIES: NUDIX domain-containing protein [Microbacterium]MDQ1113340.1 8-oxo-dGTP pyrophosphatase MutT (NUDIX family) [Microbacterium testaceum]MDR6099559.1 8-oxo-dGTP pyrophosphatase MutT (NUDIX family) [Microbacterium sp. SORGH_AS_0454]